MLQDPTTAMRSMTGGGLQAPMANDQMMAPPGNPMSINIAGQAGDAGLATRFPGAPPMSSDPATAMREANPIRPLPSTGTFNAPQTDPMGAAMPGRQPPVPAADPGMSAFQSAMQSRAGAAPAVKPVGARPAPRGPSTLSDIYRGGQMKPRGGDTRPDVGSPPQPNAGGMGGKPQPYRRPMGR